MRIGLRRLAAEAGVSVATASRALRGLANVEPATRRAVEHAAQRLGYVRDPELSHALSLVRQTDRPVYRETLALLTDWPVPAERTPGLFWLYDMHRGAVARAAELGYHTELHSAPPDARGQRRLGRELRARGVRGVIVLPITRWPQRVLRLDWPHFAAAEIGQSLAEPVLHRVHRDLHNEMLDALHRLAAGGWRRIGLALTPRVEDVMHGVPLAALLYFLRHRGWPLDVPPLEEEWDESEEGFHRWRQQHRPEVIVCNGGTVQRWLAAAGARVPQDVAVLRIDCDPASQNSGLCVDNVERGRVAVDLVTRLLEHGQLGLPQIPWTVQLPARWQEGKTLPPRCAPAARRR